MKARSRRRTVYRPRYRRLVDSGGGTERIRALLDSLRSCRLCPRACGANRLEGERGFCKTGRQARVARICLHRGEEPPLTGTCGSGTVFFAGCNLRCVYCQNHQISQAPDDESFPEISAEDLSEECLRLQQQGAHNINFVSPSHVLPQMAEAVWLAAQKGLSVPVVCNCNGYESVSSLRMVEGFVDIYLPDLKYADSETARDLSGAADYPSAALASIEEMYRQVGPLRMNEAGMALSGLIVRHLVLPGHVNGSLAVLRSLTNRLGPQVTVSLMAQYYPALRAETGRDLARTVSEAEYLEVLNMAEYIGLEDLWTQEPSSAECYRPDFRNAHPFEFS